MIRLVIWIAGVAIIAFGTAHIAAHTAPGIIMAKAVEKLAGTYDIGPNEFGHSEPITAQNQRIVRPSPDLAYSICLYDVSNGPVAVKVPKASDYLSVALYDKDTNNYFRTNDSEMDDAGVTILIAPPQDELTPVTRNSYVADKIALSPSKTGLVLIRRVNRSKEDWAVIDQERQEMSCRPWQPR